MSSTPVTPAGFIVVGREAIYGCGTTRTAAILSASEWIDGSPHIIPRSRALANKSGLYVLPATQALLDQVEASSFGAIGWVEYYLLEPHFDGVERHQHVADVTFFTNANLHQTGVEMQPKVIKLARGEHITAVVPEYCSGPGWSNAPVWVYISRANGSIYTECIQPEERTKAMHTLFAPGAAMHAALIRAVPTENVE